MTCPLHARVHVEQGPVNIEERGNARSGHRGRVRPKFRIAMNRRSPSWEVDLPMAVGAIAMSASTIVVAANAQLLRRVQLGSATA